MFDERGRWINPNRSFINELRIDEVIAYSLIVMTAVIGLLLVGIIASLFIGGKETRRYVDIPRRDYARFVLANEPLEIKLWWWLLSVHDGLVRPMSMATSLVTKLGNSSQALSLMRVVERWLSGLSLKSRLRSLMSSSAPAANTTSQSVETTMLTHGQLMQQTPLGYKPSSSPQSGYILAKALDSHETAPLSITATWSSPVGMGEAGAPNTPSNLRVQVESLDPSTIPMETLSNSPSSERN